MIISQRSPIETEKLWPTGKSPLKRKKLWKRSHKGALHTSDGISRHLEAMATACRHPSSESITDSAHQMSWCQTYPCFKIHQKATTACQKESNRGDIKSNRRYSSPPSTTPPCGALNSMPRPCGVRLGRTIACQLSSTSYLGFFDSQRARIVHASECVSR